MAAPEVDFRTHPESYRHWQLSVAGTRATLAMQVDENAGIRPGYQLKLNSYDLGVDIELADALDRIRFEHPQVRCVVITSNLERTFCSGANIFMLGMADHAWKVNFCKFTNETRNGIEDASRYSGIKFVAAVNGACAGGGYELALSCDEIILVDDRSSAVSLPEVPLLGVLPGTGGLTRLTDKRHVRHDLADVFCTTAEGVRGERAKAWRLVDDIAAPAEFEQRVQARATALSAPSSRPDSAQPIHLTPLQREVTDTGFAYEHVQVEIDPGARVARLTIRAPEGNQPDHEQAIVEAGAQWWPLAMARQLDDAILHLRTNFTEQGIWVLQTRGERQAVLDSDALLLNHQHHWFVNETIGMLRRTFARLDVSSRTLIALIEEGSCFAGTLLELAFACDRSYQLALPDEPMAAPTITLGEVNFGLYPMVTEQSRLARRFYEQAPVLDNLRAQIDTPLDADAAQQLGLITSNPDDLDWADEIRLVLEERAAMSPDGLTGLEANLRFNGKENMASRIFGRLSAWQNWIFQRPNASGEKGALKLYGSGEKTVFDTRRA